MKNLKVNLPEVTAKNINYFKGRAQLADTQISVVLDVAGQFTQTVTNRLSGIYHEIKALNSELDNTALNEAVHAARTEYLESLGMELKGDCIHVAGRPCWFINRARIGIRRGYYDALRDNIRTAKDVKALSVLRKTMDTIKTQFIEPADGNLRTFHQGEFNRLEVAYTTRTSELATAKA